MSALPPEVWFLSLAKASGKRAAGLGPVHIQKGRERAGKHVTINLERQEVTGAAGSRCLCWNGIESNWEVLPSFQGLWCWTGLTLNYATLCCVPLARKPQFLYLSNEVNKGSYFMEHLWETCEKIRANKTSGVALTYRKLSVKEISFSVLPLRHS